MQKVYLLLRSNQQTGPYSLEELLQFDLKPFDLIWIEGRSAGWYYPQEIPALVPHLSFLKQPTQASTPAPVQESVAKPSEPAGPKKIFVSMPSNTNKEEPTPKPSFSSERYYEQERPTFPPSSSQPPEEPATLKTTYTKSLDEVETDYTNWLYQAKTKKKPVISPKAVFLACLLAGSVYAAWIILQPGDSDRTTPVQQQSAQLPVQNELATDSVEETADTQTAGNSSINSKQKQKKAAVILKEERSTSSKAIPEQKTSISNAGGPHIRDVSPTLETNEEKTVTGEEKKTEPVTADAPKERKKLKDKIADLFRKKPEEKKEEAKSSEEENGERRSVRREGSSNLAQMVTVGFDVPNDWMMGIKSAKATLTNRSSETITKAVVEVVYYNDNNDVLDKRTISFSTIKSKQKQTVSVPDHTTATRLEYNVISATGAGEPFARR